MRPLIHTLIISLLLISLGSSSCAFENDPADAARFQIPSSDEGLPGAGPIRRYAWFQNLWQKRRQMWAGQIQQDQHALVFLGDSITQGWKGDMGGSFGGVKVANRGISGDTTRGVLIRLKEDVLTLNPSGVVILIGTNDLEDAASPEGTTGNLKLILAELKKHNAKMPIILCTVFPSSESKRRPADQIQKINGLYAAAVKGDPQVTLLDTWALF
ncbi:MAG: G-D-S-L family lipolytic protein, partial [Verrucomicrobia bacterium]|nr:G-D-S-L family lipolytic protein [Verrucomicrobiota bacterium]